MTNKDKGMIGKKSAGDSEGKNRTVTHRFMVYQQVSKNVYYSKENNRTWD